METYKNEFDTSINNFNKLVELSNTLIKKISNLDHIEIAYKFNQTMRDENTGIYLNFNKKLGKKVILSTQKSCIEILNTLNLTPEITISDRWYPNKLLIHIGAMGFPFTLIKDIKYKEYINYCESIKTIIK